MLAELLAERGLKTLGEVILSRKGRRPEPDVLLMLNGVRIVLEGKKPGKWEELVSQCQSRLDNNVCDLCVMVEYVDFEDALAGTLQLDQVEVKEALLNGTFNVGFMSFASRIGLEKWTNVKLKPEVYQGVGFDELLTYLMSAYTRVVSEEILDPVVSRMDEALKDFATRVSATINPDRLRDVLELREKEEGE